MSSIQEEGERKEESGSESKLTESAPLKKGSSMISSIGMKS